jgi:FAD/FMN-containing dehydrogenase
MEYATSSYQVDHDMFPGLIALPAGNEDIKRAVKYAKANGYAVSVISGGHHTAAPALHTGREFSSILEERT